jgi:hypothetical protein
MAVEDARLTRNGSDLEARILRANRTIWISPILERRMPMKIAIVGAGIGGLAAALAMTQAGFTV